MINRILLSILIVLNVADFYTTKIIVCDRGGMELNKVLAKLMNKIGVIPALLAIKGGVIVLLVKQSQAMGIGST